MKSYPSIPLPPSVFNLQSHPFELQVWHGAKWSVGIVNSPHLVVTHFSLQYFEESSKKWKIQYRPSEIQNHEKFGVQSYKIFIHCTWVTVPLLLALLLAPSLPSSSIRKYWSAHCRTHKYMSCVNCWRRKRNCNADIYNKTRVIACLRIFIEVWKCFKK